MPVVEVACIIGTARCLTVEPNPKPDAPVTERTWIWHDASTQQVIHASAALLAYCSGCSSNFVLQPSPQKWYVVPWCVDCSAAV